MKLPLSEFKGTEGVWVREGKFSGNWHLDVFESGHVVRFLGDIKYSTWWLWPRRAWAWRKLPKAVQQLCMKYRK